MANIFLVRGRVLVVVLFVCVVGLAAREQSPAQRADGPQPLRVVPLVISGELPKPNPTAILANVVGLVVVRVTTDGEKVTAVEPLRSAPMFTDRVVAAVRTWRFAAHPPTSFETIVHFQPTLREPRCFNFDRNTDWSLDLPLRVDVRPPAGILCDQWSSDVARTQSLRGRIRCNCPGEAPIGGAKIDARPLAGTDFLETTTDKDGWFDFGRVLPGKYQLSISKERFFSRSIWMEVSADGRRELELTLEYDNKTPLPSPAITLAGDVPIYPEAARRDGIEGVVRLRMTADRTVSVVRGPPALAPAALANVRTWTFVESPREPFEIGFVFTLLPGDCSGDQNPHVLMRMPAQVDVMARRPAACPASVSPASSIPMMADADFPKVAPIVEQAAITGDVRLRVTTDGSTARNVELIGSDVGVAAGLVTASARDLVRSWRFAPHAPTTFETVVRLRTRRFDCSDHSYKGDIRTVSRLPTDVTIFASMFSICEPDYPRISSTRTFAPVRSLRGTVRCDCHGAAPLPNARIEAYVTSPGRSALTAASTMTDEHGRFAFGPLPPGRYNVSVSEVAGMKSDTFIADVSANASEGSLDLQLRPDPEYRAPIELLPGLSTGKVPEYPETLRQLGLEGDVTVKVYTDGTVVYSDGNAALAGAARANLKSATFHWGSSDFTYVRYRYRLLPGDCSADQNPTVIQRWNNVFEVTAKRIVQCGPGR